MEERFGVKGSTVGGILNQSAVLAAAANPPAKLAIYEENMGTIQGTASQALVNANIAGVGAGLSTAVNQLLLLRDLGITDQNFFALASFDPLDQPDWRGTVSPVSRLAAASA